ncbi:hypothetical protein DYH09_01170 [bacterium CPR1]|nr:hypothetical protein [bacterium CPR1]
MACLRDALATVLGQHPVVFGRVLLVQEVVDGVWWWTLLNMWISPSASIGFLFPAGVSGMLLFSQFAGSQLIDCGRISTSADVVSGTLA